MARKIGFKIGAEGPPQIDPANDDVLVFGDTVSYVADSFTEVEPYAPDKFTVDQSYRVSEVHPQKTEKQKE